MGGRRIARELALQALYHLDMQREGPGFWEHFLPEDVARGGEVEQYARELIAGVDEHRSRLDDLIAEAAEHWRLPRLSRVDLCLLRLATFELLCRPEIPVAVVIDEAVEIARRFGAEDSAAFVNGVLDHVAQKLRGRARVETGE